MKILVTGANGYVGRKLVSALIAHGHEVSVLVRSEEKLAELDWVKKVAVINYKDASAESYAGQECVVHLAGESSTEINEKLRYEKGNTALTREVFTKSKQGGVKKFIFVSSATVNDRTPSAYAQSKLSSEREIHRLNEKEPIDVCILRPGHIYGEGMNGNIVAWIEKINKNFPKLPPTNAALSMISRKDFCKVVLRCLENDKVWGKTFSISDGLQYNLNELEAEIRAMLGKDTKWTIPKASLFIAALCGEILQKMKLKQSAFDYAKYSRLFQRPEPVTTDFARLTGFRPTVTFIDTLPEIMQ